VYDHYIYSDGVDGQAGTAAATARPESRAESTVVKRRRLATDLNDVSEQLKTNSGDMSRSMSEMMMVLQRERAEQDERRWEQARQDRLEREEREIRREEREKKEREEREERERKEREEKERKERNERAEREQKAREEREENARREDAKNQQFMMALAMIMRGGAVQLPQPAGEG